MDIRDYLVAARAKVERGWIKFACARNAEGRWVNPASDEACCWCAAGAIQAVFAPKFNTFPPDYMAALHALAYAVRGKPVAHPINYLRKFNDRPGTTKEMVLAVYDRAIASV